MTNQEKGLYGKYYIQKIKHVPIEGDFMGLLRTESKLVPVDSDADYFVLRLDENQKDKVHMNACRRAVLLYAQLIKEHLPQLSKDLIEKYSI